MWSAPSRNPGAVERTAPNGSERVLALHNVSRESVTLRIPDVDSDARDLLRGVHGEPGGIVTLSPYMVGWLSLPAISDNTRR